MHLLHYLIKDAIGFNMCFLPEQLSLDSNFFQTLQYFFQFLSNMGIKFIISVSNREISFSEFAFLFQTLHPL